jgi:hypothetical protein
LELGGAGRNLGVKAGRGGRDQIHRHRLAGILLVEGGGIGADAIDQLLIGRSKIRATGVGRVIPLAGAGWPRVKIIGISGENYGGTIGVVSQLGSGSVFSFSLPVEEKAK